MGKVLEFPTLHSPSNDLTVDTARLCGRKFKEQIENLPREEQVKATVRRMEAMQDMFPQAYGWLFGDYEPVAATG